MRFHFGGIYKAVDSRTTRGFSSFVCCKRTKKSSACIVQQILRRLVLLTEIYVILIF